VDWIKSIYEGPFHTSKVSNELVAFRKHYSEYSQTNQNSFMRRLNELALDSDGVFHDITFKLDNGLVTGHKVLFQSNSSFFAAILGNGMLESTQTEIALPNIDVTTFGILKSFLYGCVPVLTLTNVVPALTVANQYTLQELESDCCYFIYQNFEDYNVFELLNLALQIKSQVLENYCCWYLKVNFDQYSHKSGFKQLDSSLQEVITTEQWPGPEFRTNFAIWEKKVREYREKKKKTANQDKNCVVQ